MMCRMPLANKRLSGREQKQRMNMHVSSAEYFLIWMKVKRCLTRHFSVSRSEEAETKMIFILPRNVRGILMCTSQVRVQDIKMLQPAIPSR